MKKINSYPFMGIDGRQIKDVSDRIGIVYHSDNSFDVYFDNSLIDDEIRKGVLCYYKFLSEQRVRYINDVLSKDYGDKMPSINTHLDIIIMYINDVISFSKNNSIVPQSIDILYRLNGNPCDYRYLQCVIDLLMNDDFFVNSKGTKFGIINEVSNGNLGDVVNSFNDVTIYNQSLNSNKVLSLKKQIG